MAPLPSPGPGSGGEPCDFIRKSDQTDLSGPILTKLLPEVWDESLVKGRDYFKGSDYFLRMFAYYISFRREPPMVELTRILMHSVVYADLIAYTVYKLTMGCIHAEAWLIAQFPSFDEVSDERRHSSAQSLLEKMNTRLDTYSERGKAIRTNIVRLVQILEDSSSCHSDAEVNADREYKGMNLLQKEFKDSLFTLKDIQDTDIEVRRDFRRYGDMTLKERNDSSNAAILYQQHITEIMHTSAICPEVLEWIRMRCFW